MARQRGRNRIHRATQHPKTCPRRRTAGAPPPTRPCAERAQPRSPRSQPRLPSLRATTLGLADAGDRAPSASGTGGGAGMGRPVLGHTEGERGGEHWACPSTQTQTLGSVSAGHQVGDKTGGVMGSSGPQKPEEVAPAASGQAQTGRLAPDQASTGSAGAAAVRCPQHPSLPCPSGSWAYPGDYILLRKEGWSCAPVSVGTESQGPLHGHPCADTGSPSLFQLGLHCLRASSPEIQPQGPPRRAGAKPVGPGSEFFPQRTQEPSTSWAPLHRAGSSCSRPSLTPPPRVGCVPPSRPLPPCGGQDRPSGEVRALPSSTSLCRDAGARRGPRRPRPLTCASG